MSAKHTPGPWVVNKSFKPPVVGFDVGDGGELLPIADVVHGYNQREAKANARLIALSPELLAFVESWLADFTAAGTTDSPREAEARALIAKARGEA